MSQKGRKPKYTDQQLEVAAYTIYRNTWEWPSVEDFKSIYSCSFERARRAINEARITVAGASIEATHFEALAVYAGFESIDAALSKILALQKAPSNLSKMKKSELRAAVIMRCPQKYSPYLTANELRAILRDHRTSDSEQENKDQRDAEIDNQSPKELPRFPLRFSFQEYGSERRQRNRDIISDDFDARNAMNYSGKDADVAEALASSRRFLGLTDEWRWAEPEMGPGEFRRWLSQMGSIRR